MRFVEIALFAAPFLVFAAWRLLAPAGAPPKILAIWMIAVVLTLGVLLLALRARDAVAPGTPMEPARQENGQIIPPHVDRLK